MTMRLRNIFRAFVLFLLVFTFLAGYLSILGYGQTTTLPHRRHLEVNVSGNCVGKEVTIKTTDRGDNPIPRVRVDVYLGGISVEKILTDSDGMASFIPADAGEYEIKLTKTRYRSQEVILSVIYCESSTTTTTTTTTSTTTTYITTTTTTTSPTTTTSTTTTTRVTTTSTTTTIPVTTTTLAEESDVLNIFIILFAGLLVVAFSYVLYSRFRRVEETEDIVKDRSRGEEETHKSFEEKKRKIKEELESIKKLNRELKTLRELQKKRPKRSKKSSKKPSRHRKKRSEGGKA